jgi:hypothetical protein
MKKSCNLKELLHTSRGDRTLTALAIAKKSAHLVALKRLQRENCRGETSGDGSADDLPAAGGDDAS